MVVPGSVEDHQGTVLIESGAVTVTNGLKGQVGAPVGDQGVARTHLVRACGRGGTGHVLHVASLGASLRPHQIVEPIPLVHVGPLRICPGGPSADSLPLRQDCPRAHIQTGQVDTGDLPITFLVNLVAFIAADVDGSIVIEEEGGVDTGPPLDPQRIGPSLVGIRRGHDHGPLVDVGDNQVEQAIMPAQGGSVNAPAVAHALAGELGGAVHGVPYQGPMLPVTTLVFGKPREILERAVDQEVAARRGPADGRVRVES